MKSFCLFFLMGFVFFSMFAGCSIDASKAHIESLVVETPMAPEVRGASRYQTPNTYQVRGFVQMGMGKTQNEKLHGIKNPIEDCKIGVCEIPENLKEYEKVDASYKIIFSNLMASLDWIEKKDLLLWGVGTALDRGLYVNAFVGINTRHFEVGAFTGVWFYANRLEYGGHELICQRNYWEGEYGLTTARVSEKENGLYDAMTYGGFASIYYGRFSLGYSVNVYKHSVDQLFDEKDVVANFELPWIVTEYITAGVFITPKVEMRVGAVNVFGEFDGWHWGGTSGISYYFY